MTTTWPFGWIDSQVIFERGLSHSTPVAACKAFSSTEHQPGTPAQENGRDGEICLKGTKDTVLTSYPRTDVRDDHWGGGCVFEILEFTKVVNSGNLKILSKG